MCDQNLLGILIVAAEAAVTIATVMLALAIQQGKSIFTAFQSLSTSYTVAGLIAAAAGSLLIARGVAASGCTTGPCGMQGADLLSALDATAVALGIVAGWVAVCATVPGAAALIGPGALIALLGAAAGFAFLGAKLGSLTLCFAGLGTASGWLWLALSFAFTTAFVLAVVAIYGIIVTIETAIEEASG